MYPGASLWLLLSLLALCRAADPAAASWGDWIIVDEAEPGTSVLLRRITPKSVFVAPTFGCSEGYRQDSLGRCVKHVKVNHAEQWKFYLERLNSMYAPSSSNKKPQKETGPFHISLPIGSEKPQGEEVTVKKRLPPAPVVRDQVVQTTTSTTTTTTSTEATTTTTTPPPATTTLVVPRELTTPEATQFTMVNPVEATQTETPTEGRTPYEVTEMDSSVMLGDQPISTEDLTEADTPETPKNDSPPQTPDKPFVIIVTNEPTAQTEETTFIPTSVSPLTTEREEEETVGETSTVEAATEGTTETTMRYTTDSTPKPTEYDERFSEVIDIVRTSKRPNIRYTTSTIKPKCDPETSDDYDSSECEPAESELVSHTRIVTNPYAPLPSSLPMLEPNTHVRFPSESYVPVRKTQQTFVRFPETMHPHNDRPALFWPSWHVRQHPGIRGWPPPEDPQSEPMIHKQYPPYPHSHTSWSDSNSWRRRILQRD